MNDKEKIETIIFEAVKHGDVAWASRHIRRLKDPNAQDKHGKTFLHHAVLLKNPEPMVRLLLESGADTSAKDNEGKTAHDYFVEREAEPAIGSFLDLLASDIRAGRHVRAIPDDLARSMLEHGQREAKLDEDIDGEVYL